MACDFIADVERIETCGRGEGGGGKGTPSAACFQLFLFPSTFKSVYQSICQWGMLTRTLLLFDAPSRRQHVFFLLSAG